MRTRSILLVGALFIAASVGAVTWTTSPAVEPVAASSPSTSALADASPSRGAALERASGDQDARDVADSPRTLASGSIASGSSARERVEQLLVRVKDPQGRGVGAIEVEIRTGSDPPVTSIERTDANGEIRIEHVELGTYRVAALGPRAGMKAKVAVNILRGVCTEVDLTLADASVVWAVDGIVVDEKGQPLADVDLSFATDPNDRPARIPSGADGRFRFASAPCESVVISVDPSMDGDEFEPARIEVPFGATNVMIRRARVLPEIDVFVQLVDAVDRTKLRGRVRIRSDDHRVSGSVEGDPLWLHCKVRPNWRFSFRAPDHRTRFGTLDELARFGAEQRIVEIELGRGFEEEIAVWDVETREPLAGANVTAPEGIAEITDASGRVVLRGSSRPASIRIEHEGYEPAELDASNERRFTGDVALTRSETLRPHSTARRTLVLPPTHPARDD